MILKPEIVRIPEREKPVSQAAITRLEQRCHALEKTVWMVHKRVFEEV